METARNTIYIWVTSHIPKPNFKKEHNYIEFFQNTQQLTN